jgi:hypothetical protein
VSRVSRLLCEEIEKGLLRKGEGGAQGNECDAYSRSLNYSSVKVLKAQLYVSQYYHNSLAAHERTHLVSCLALSIIATFFATNNVYSFFDQINNESGKSLQDSFYTISIESAYMQSSNLFSSVVLRTFSLVY